MSILVRKLCFISIFSYTNLNIKLLNLNIFHNIFRPCKKIYQINLLITVQQEILPYMYFFWICCTYVTNSNISETNMWRDWRKRIEQSLHYVVLLNSEVTETEFCSTKVGEVSDWQFALWLSETTAEITSKHLSLNMELILYGNSENDAYVRGEKKVFKFVQQIKTHSEHLLCRLNPLMLGGGGGGALYCVSQK